MQHNSGRKVYLQFTLIHYNMCVFTQPLYEFISCHCRGKWKRTNSKNSFIHSIAAVSLSLGHSSSVLEVKERTDKKNSSCLASNGKTIPVDLESNLQRVWACVYRRYASLWGAVRTQEQGLKYSLINCRASFALKRKTMHALVLNRPREDCR